MFRASCSCFPLKLGLIVHSPPRLIFGKFQSMGKEPNSVWVLLLHTFSPLSRVLRDGGNLFMDSAGILFSVLGLVVFCAVLCVRDGRPLILTIPPSLDSTVQPLHLGCFLCLLLLNFLSLLNSTN